MKNSTSYILPLCFCSMILLGVLNNLFGFWTFPQKNENRNFTKKPVLNVQKLDPYPKEFEEYYNDHFSFRTPLLDIFHRLKYYAYGVSAHPDKTAIGNDGWCFDADRSKDIYAGDLDFTPEQVEKFRKVWRERKAYFDAKNITLLWVIAPMKHYIYEEELPINFVRSKGPTRPQSLVNALGTEFPGLIMDPAGELREAKDSIKLFYKLDNHWNLKAGYIVSNLIIRSLKSAYTDLAYIPYDAFTWNEKGISAGNNYNDLGIAELSETDHFPHQKAEVSVRAENYDFPVPSGFAYPDMYQHRFLNNSGAKKPRLLVIMDSFGERLMPFLPYSFEESVFIFDNWEYKLNEDIVEKVKPDIVVYLTLEKLLHHLIEEK